MTSSKTPHTCKKDTVMEREEKREMGSKPDPEATSKLRLSFFSLPTLQPEPLGTIASPTRAGASVPFLWEEAPGKPRAFEPTLPEPKFATSLKLPPRLLADDKFISTPSHSKNLDTPYLDRSFSCSSSHGGEDQWDLDAVVYSKREHKERGYFGSWRRTLKGNKGVRGDCVVFLSSGGGGCGGGGGDINTKAKITKTKRSWSLTNVSLTKSHFWASIYGSFKQVVPWSRRK